MYQLAKQRMLEFYYDFLDGYFHCCENNLIQMDTDSNYITISADQLGDIIRPQLRAEFEAKKNEWLAWDKWSGRMTWLFKLKCEGSRMISLCPKCYYVDEQDSENKKFSTKGMQKWQNAITWQHFIAASNSSIDRAENRGFHMVCSGGAKWMATGVDRLI